MTNCSTLSLQQYLQQKRITDCFKYFKCIYL